MIPAQVVLVRTTTADLGMGDTSATETEIPMLGCLYAPESGGETTDPNRPALRWSAAVFAPAGGPTVDADDKLRIDGELYVVDGPPQEWGIGSRIAVRRWATAP